MEITEDIHHDGTRRWCLADGRSHRDDGPAVIWSDGTQEWLQNGKHHRLGEPAVIHPSGYQMWFHHGKNHREDGPAIIYADGCEQWWINDVDITDKVAAWIQENDLPAWQAWDDETKILFRMRFA